MNEINGEQIAQAIREFLEEGEGLLPKRANDFTRHWLLGIDRDMCVITERARGGGARVRLIEHTKDYSYDRHVLKHIPETVRIDIVLEDMEDARTAMDTLHILLRK